MISLIFLLRCYLWPYGLRLLLVHFLHIFFFWVLLANAPAGPAHSIPWASSAHFIPWASLARFIPQASSAHFLLLYLFHSHGLLLNPLGFPSPIITYLPLIIFQVYWPLCQPYEFTNSFLGLPQPILLFLHLLLFPYVYYFIPQISSAHLLLPSHLLFLWAC